MSSKIRLVVLTLLFYSEPWTFCFWLQCDRSGLFTTLSARVVYSTQLSLLQTWTTVSHIVVVSCHIELTTKVYSNDTQLCFSVT